MEEFEQIYLSALGLPEDSFQISWVENAFAPGSICDTEYGNMRSAYERLCLRLNTTPDAEDVDLNIILDSLEHIQKQVCSVIFKAGIEYQKRLYK